MNVILNDCRKISFGEKVSIPKIKITPIINAENVVTVVDVFNTLFISFVGKYLIRALSNPNKETNIMKLSEEINAEAIPTSFRG
jgi:hypothetical protein